MRGAEAAQWEAVMIGKLIEIIERYDVNMVAIDYLPEPRLGETLAARFPGRVFLVSYDTSSNPKPGQLWNVDHENYRVTVHRTSAIDAMLAAFRQQHNLIPDLEELPERYADELGSLVRIVERDDKDKLKVYYRSTGPDDAGQAEVYDVVATEVFHHMQGLGLIEQAGREPEPMRDELGIDEEPIISDEGGDRLDEGDWGGSDWR
jgi:hypothetical protein